MNEIIHGDCLDVLRTLPDKSFDCVITDPPYGIGEAAGKNKSRSKMSVSKDYGNLSWDNERASKEYFEEMFRVSKNQIIFGGNYYTDYTPPSSCWIVWDKLNGETDFADCELAWTSFKRAVRKVTFRWQGMLQGDMKNKEIRFHPTQKPEEVMKWIIYKFTSENETILDPFAGSGSTLVAAKRLKRQFLGIEREEAYVKIARARLEAVQDSLF